MRLLMQFNITLNTNNYKIASDLISHLNTYKYSKYIATTANIQVTELARKDICNCFHCSKSQV